MTAPTPSCTAIPTSASSTAPRHPEELVAEAARLGLDALALTDHDGLYGVVRFAETARALGLPSVFGAELTLVGAGAGRRRAPALPDPAGTHLVVLARDPEGYARLSRAIAEAHLAGGEKGKPIVHPRRPGRTTARAGTGWSSPAAARERSPPPSPPTAPPPRPGQLDRLIEAFGRDDVAVELWDHGDPLDTARNDALARLAVDRGVDLVATNNVHYATAGPAAPGHRPGRRPGPAAPGRARRVAPLGGHRPPARRGRAGAPLRPVARGGRPGPARSAAACAFDLRLVAPRLPDFPVPPGHTEQTWLVELVAPGRRPTATGRGDDERVPGAWAQIDHELDVIGTLGFAGYFLIVWDIVEFCRRQDIYCQGRGSAANSAVCFALGITRADAVALGPAVRAVPLPRARRTTRHRRRHRVGPARGGHRVRLRALRPSLHAAQVANVITYRARSAIRDMGKALGHSPEEVDALGQGGRPRRAARPRRTPAAARRATWPRQVLDFPRHLGLHSGGMVICDRPVVEVCPVEWARHAGTHVPCSGTRTTAPRPGSSSSTCSDWACSTPCTTRST